MAVPVAVCEIFSVKEWFDLEETAPKLSNGTTFNDLELPLTPISTSRYYSTSNNSQTVQDRAIVTMAD